MRDAFLAIALMFGLVSCHVPSDAGRDVVLVVLDTTRADHLGVYGYRRDTTPFLDSLSQRAWVFENAYSTSAKTAPATASLFTGLYPREHGVTTGFHAHGRHVEDLARDGRASIPMNRIPSGQPTLPEALQAAGYRSFGLASNINIGSEMGFDRGFDYFERRPESRADELAGVLASWSDALDASPDPIFLYLHLNDAHRPYEGRAPWFETWDAEDSADPDGSAAYDSEIRFIDEVLAGLFARHPRLDDALLVVTSDHGEEFRDHGGVGHGFTLYRELNRVALIVRAPPLGAAPAGVPDAPSETVRIAESVSLIDVLPTIAQWAGLPAHPSWTGSSLWPLVANGPSALPFAKRAVYAEKGQRGEQELYAVMHRGWKHIWRPGKYRVLYDIEGDPFELTSRFRQDEEPGASLHALLVAYREAATADAATAESVEVELDAERLEHLRALGYVGAGDDARSAAP